MSYNYQLTRKWIVRLLSESHEEQRAIDDEIELIILGYQLGIYQ